MFEIKVVRILPYSYKKIWIANVGDRFEI